MAQGDRAKRYRREIPAEFAPIVAQALLNLALDYTDFIVGPGDDGKYIDMQARSVVHALSINNEFDEFLRRRNGES